MPGDEEPILLSPQAQRVITQRTQMTKHSSALVPRSILTLPIWVGTKTESSSYSRTWRWGAGPDDISTVEVVNPVALGQEGSGLLRYFDLDMVMGLSHEAIRQGARTFRCDQADILRWMGCTRELRPPRYQVHGSLRRLRMASIATYRGQDPQAISSDAIDTLQILGHAKIASDRKHVRLSVSLSDDWIHALEVGTWQEVDLDCYAHLARTSRRNGLARVLYCALTCHRSKDLQTFAVPWASLNARYVNRHQDGRLRHVHFTPSNPVAKALHLLAERGVVEYDFSRTEEGVIAGRFRYDRVPRLDSQPRQQVLFDQDFIGSIKNLPINNEQADSQPSSPPLVPQDSEAPKKKPDWHPKLDLCRELVPGLGKKAMQEAIEGGWEKKPLGWLTVWVAWSQEYGYDGADRAAAAPRWVVRYRSSQPGDWNRQSVVRMVMETDHYVRDPAQCFDKWMTARGLLTSGKA